MLAELDIAMLIAAPIPRPDVGGPPPISEEMSICWPPKPPLKSAKSKFKSSIWPEFCSRGKYLSHSAWIFGQ